MVVVADEAPELLWQKAPDLAVASFLSKKLDDVQVRSGLQRVLKGEIIPSPWASNMTSSGQPVSSLVLSPGSPEEASPQWNTAAIRGLLVQPSTVRI